MISSMKQLKKGSKHRRDVPTHVIKPAFAQNTTEMLV